MTTSIRTRVLAASIGGLALLATVGGAPASAKAGDIRVNGTCSSGVTSKIKLGARDGGIETEFEVDSNRNGQRWSVRMRQNGVLVHDGSAVTVAPSGSFTVRKRLANKAGSDRITAVARNATTGQSCTVTATI